MQEELQYAVVLRREALGDGTWTWFAYHPDLPGAESDGTTPEEAVSNLAEARALVLEHLAEHDLPAPAPGSSRLGRVILEGAR